MFFVVLFYTDFYCKRFWATWDNFFGQETHNLWKAQAHFCIVIIPIGILMMYFHLRLGGTCVLRNRRIRNLRCSRSLKNPEEMMAIRIVMTKLIFEVKLWSLKIEESWRSCPLQWSWLSGCWEKSKKMKDNYSRKMMMQQTKMMTLTLKRVWRSWAKVDDGKVDGRGRVGRGGQNGSWR